MIRPPNFVSWIKKRWLFMPMRWSLPEDFFRIPAVIVLSLALFAGLLWGIQVVPEWQVQRVGVHTGADLGASKPAEVASLENEHRKTALQALGGIFAIIALWYTYRRVKVSEQGQITDRFTKAIEQLGALTADGKPNIEVRLGAIYALERIAQDSPRDHWTIMEVLTAYVRRNAPAPTEPPMEEENKAAVKKGPSTEVQAILTVLGRRKRDRGREHNWWRLNLSDSDLRGADCIGAHLEGARFAGAHMEGAWFNLAHMERTSFIYVHMERVIFLGAYMEGASFNGAQLERADFSNAVGLTVEQFRSAKGWEQAVFDPAFRRELKAAKEKKYAAEPPSGEQQKGPPR